MGEIAELIIEGEICELCQCELADPQGYPQRCKECGGEAAEWVPEDEDDDEDDDEDWDDDDEDEFDETDIP